jgi:hypothetical protein
VALVRLLFGGRYTDLCYGYNAFWASVLPILALNGTGFEIETMMNVRALREGLRISEVPSFERSRIHGVSNLRTFRDGWRVLRTIVRERLPSRRPITSWVEPGEEAQPSFDALGDVPRPHLVPVMDSLAAGQLQLAFDRAAVLPPEGDTSLVPVGEAALQHLVPVIDMLRAGLQLAIDGPASDPSEEEASLA